MRMVTVLVGMLSLLACGCSSDSGDDGGGPGPADTQAPADTGADPGHDDEHDGDEHGTDDGEEHADEDGEQHGAEDGEEHAEEDGHEHGTGSLGAHIHTIQRWGTTDEIVLGTHEGIFRTSVGQSELTKVGGTGDFMGFVQSPSTPMTYWGSGHWAAGGYPNWGFIESTDGGVTWEEISLTGVVDFHQMAVSPDQAGLVAGTWNGKLYTSVDSGREWEIHTWAKAAAGLEIEAPAGPVLLVAGQDGIERVTAPTMTVEPVVSGVVTGLDRFGAGFAYGTADGDLQRCDATFAACETLAGPKAGKLVHVLDVPGDPNAAWVLTAASKVFHTDNGGTSWDLIVEVQ